MNILYIVPYVPSPIYVRPFNLIRSLTKGGHRVTVLTVTANETDRLAAGNLSQYCEKVYGFPLPAWRSLVNCAIALPKQAPLQASYSWHPDLVEYAAELVSNREPASRFHMIHVEHLRGARFGLSLKERLPARIADKAQIPPIVWDSVDSITHLFKQAARYAEKQTSRLMARLELSRTARYEGWLLRQFAHVFVTSKTDRDALLSLAQGQVESERISILPNGVDLDEFYPGDDSLREPDTLILSGKMSYHANVSMTLYMIKEIMPRIWLEKPEVKVWIVGKDPPREILTLSQNPLVTVTGAVPKLSEYLRRASVAVAPLRYGAGIQNKVLEAMACGAPVVTNSHALKSIGAVPGTEIVSADDPDEYSRQVLYLLMNARARHAIGMAGRRYVEDNHNWDRIVFSLERVYDRLQSQMGGLRSQ